jgi:branched-chain amino acid transport system permease protein
MTTVSAAADISSTPARRMSVPAIWVAALLVVAIAAPLLVSNYRVFQFTQITVYAIAVLGLNLLTGFSGQISLGNGAFYALGAYTAVILIKHAGVPYWVTPVVAAGVCFAAGYVFGRSATRLEGLYLALATFGLAVITPQLLKLDTLERWTGGNQGVVIDKPASPLPDLISNDQWLYYVCLMFAIVLFVGAWNVVRGRTGRALVALRDHPIAAGTMGINVTGYKSAVFGVSAMYTGLAGALGALLAGFVAPDSFQLPLSILFLIGGVVGGIASIFGTLFGAVFIELVPDLSKQVSELSPSLSWLADIQYPMFGALLIITMIAMPSGVAGLVYNAQLRRARAAAQRSRT